MSEKIKKQAKEIVKSSLLALGTGIGALVGEAVVESIFEEKKKKKKKTEKEKKESV